MNKMNSLLTIVATIHISFLILSTDKYGILIDSSGIAKKDFTYNKGKGLLPVTHIQIPHAIHSQAGVLFRPAFRDHHDNFLVAGAG